MDEPEYLQALIARRYEKIGCGAGGEWDLRFEAKRCYPYWTEHERNRRDQDDVPI